MVRWGPTRQYHSVHMETSTETVIEITPDALAQIMELREAESIPDLHLGLRITGMGAQGFIYETSFVRGEDVVDSDLVEYHGDLPVVIDADSVDDLRDSVLDLSADPSAPGLVLRNPNQATPPMPDFDEIELVGSLRDRITQLLDQQINPAIAAHGGYVKLVGLEGSIAHLEMGGGCQGCGLAAMTLRQGIETAIKQHIPEITEIIDATDHTSGANPYY